MGSFLAIRLAELGSQASMRPSREGKRAEHDANRCQQCGGMASMSSRRLSQLCKWKMDSLDFFRVIE
jgi:hypothetical protein